MENLEIDKNKEKSILQILNDEIKYKTSSKKTKGFLIVIYIKLLMLILILMKFKKY